METLEQLMNRLKKMQEMMYSLNAEGKEVREKINLLAFKDLGKYVGKVFKTTSAYHNRTSYDKILKFDSYKSEDDLIHVISLRVNLDDRGVYIHTYYDYYFRLKSFLDEISFIEEEEFQDAMNRAL